MFICTVNEEINNFFLSASGYSEAEIRAYEAAQSIQEKPWQSK